MIRKPLLLAFLCLGTLVQTPVPLLAQGGCNGGGGNGGGTPPPPPPPPPPGSSSGGGGAPGVPATQPPSTPSGPVAAPSAPRRASSPRRGPSVGSTRPTTTAPASPRRSSVPADDSVWSAWWALNQHPYLGLRTRLASIGVATGSDEFYLGLGAAQVAAERGTRPPAEVVRKRIAPALRRELEESSNPDVLSACLVGLGRLGPDPETATLLSQNLGRANREVREAALVGLGLLGDAHSAFLLADVVDDRPRARELVGSSSVDDRTRAFAAYALALLCERTEREDVRRYAVHRLTETLAGPAGERQEVAVACVTALGLAPLEAAGPAGRRSTATSSLEAQVAWLIDYFGDEDDRLVQSHAATALARTVERLPAEAAEREAAIEALLTCVGPRSKSPAEVQQAAVLGLGRVVDADMDPIDHRARKVLSECTRRTGDPILRHFAMVAQAQASARPGQGQTLAGAEPTQKQLLRELSRGKSTARPWAALSLGLLERGLLDAGGEGSSDVRFALRTSLREARSPDEIGASAIALGLARDTESLDLLSSRLADVSDDATRGHLAIAIGMVGDLRGLSPIADVQAEATERPLLLRETARACGLLGDEALVPSLTGRLAEAGTFTSQSAIAAALAEVGDARSVEALMGLLESDAATDGARAFAADALARICDPAALPRETGLVVGVNYRAATPSFSSLDGSGVVDVL